MKPETRQKCIAAVASCETALGVLHPLVFRHKTDFGELQIGLLALGKAKEALSEVIEDAP